MISPEQPCLVSLSLSFEWANFRRGLHVRGPVLERVLPARVNRPTRQVFETDPESLPPEPAHHF